MCVCVCIRCRYYFCNLLIPYIIYSLGSAEIHTGRTHRGRTLSMTRHTCYCTRLTGLFIDGLPSGYNIRIVCLKV